MAHFNAGFHKRLLKGEAAADKKTNEIILPVFGSICHFIDLHAVFIDKVPRNIGDDIRSLAHIMDQRGAVHDLEDRTRFRITLRELFKILRIFFRQDHKVCLCVSPAHSGCRFCDLTVTDLFPDLFRSCRSVISHFSLPLSPMPFFSFPAS